MVVLCITFVIYMIFIYQRSLPSRDWYTKWSRKVDCESAISDKYSLITSAFSTALFQVLLNTMPQKLELMHEVELDENELPHENYGSLTVRSPSLYGETSMKRRGNGNTRVVPVDPECTLNFY